MAPMVRLGSLRSPSGPSALRAAAAGRGECLRLPAVRRPSIRSIATAAVREPGAEFPSNAPPAQTPSRQSARERIQAVEKAKPFSDFLTDNFQRQHDYLRISITERCNLRCLYCMPEEGIPLSPPATMLTTPEIFYLSSLFVSQGVTKIRLTGGEPTVRRDIVPLMQQIGSLRPKGLRELALTTNGISLHRKLDAMVEAGLTGVNLSLDTLDPFQFQIMTRRKGFDAVMKSIDRILEMNKLGANVKLKVNCVVMRGLNEREILPFVEMGREKDIEVRFIEYMPFGGNKWSENKMISFQEMVDIIRTKYPGLARIPGHKNDTSKTYKVPGFVGKVGFISSMTNDFCSSCNRLRITSDGNLKVCLHGNDEVSLRDLLRQDNNNQPIDEAAFERIKQIELDRHHGRLSDSTILGWGPRERQLLGVIGQAVKRKAEKHADMGDLATMQNRPMILIDQQQRSYKHAATQPTQWRPRSAPTVTSILASNAYLNPLLGHDLGSARLFSTTSSQGGGAFSTTDSRNPSNDDTNQPSNPRRAIPASRQRSRKTLQAEQKPQLILDLSSSSSAPESTDLDLEDLAPAALDARLADLAHRLRAAKAVDWDALYRDAQESRSLKNHLDYDYQNMQHSQKATAERKLKEEYEARVSEIKQQRADHELHIRELEDSYAKLVIYVGRRRAKEQGGEEVSERSSRRSEVRRRKDAVLRKKDELAVRMARLKATQAGIQVTTPSAPDAVDATALNASDLRIDLPNGSFMIDATTSFDTRAATSVLRKQVRHLQSCLLAFHPRLDALPSGASAAASDKHTLQTYLKVLIGRYREKTGVLGYRTPEAEAAQAAQSVGDLGVKTLSEEARQRIADKWNEKFSANRGFVMTPEALQEVQKANEKMAESQRARKERVLRNAESASNTEWLEDAGASVENKKPRTAEGGQSKVRPQQRVEAAFEEFNENGFLEDEPATEDQVRAADEVEEVRGSSAEPDRTALGKEMNEVEVEESGEKTALIEEQAAADEMDAEEAIETTAPEPSQSKDILPPTSSETIEADKTKHSTVPSLPPFHGIAGINDSAATTDSLPSPSPPTSPQPKRPVVPVPIPIPGKPKTHAYFGRRTSIYGDVEKRLRRIEKKKAAKNPLGVDTSVSPSVTAAIDALLLEYFDKFDERLKANKIEDHLTVGLVKRVKGGGSPVHRQDGKVVSPVFWAARFAVLKQERIRKTAVWPLKYPRSKTLEQQAASEQEAEEELQPSTATENEKDFRDPTRKARIAAELALLRRATTLRQDEGEPNAAPGEARAARTSIQKPLITYESSLQPKGFVMKKQRSAVAEQKKKTSTLMKQTSNTPKLIDTRAQSVSSSTGPAMAANTQFRPRRNLTVRSMMRHAYSTSSQSLDPLNEGLRAKEHESSETNASPPPPSAPPQPYLPHLTPTGSAHMVSISSKSHTTRTAIAVGTVYFSNPTPLTLITSNSLKKGDVLSVSRVAGIMAAKKCPDIVPLCHPIPLTHVGVELVTFSAHSAPVSTSPAGQGSDKMEYGGVAIECKVACTGATGVEMEALTAVMGTALSVVDMCKAVDKFQRIGDVRVVLKEGGKSGVWREEGWVSSVH